MTRRIGSLLFLVVPALAAASGGSKAVEEVPADVTQGRQIYEQYCAACHGVQGEGATLWQKPDENGEMPAPPHDETGHTWRHSDAMLFKMISQGWRHPFNKTDRLTMPAFGESLDDQEIGKVIEYLKTLWSDEQWEYQSAESQ